MSAILFGDETKTHLQQITDALRTIDPSVFLKAAMRDIDVTCPTVIDSVRFASDFAIVRDAGYRIIRVSAPSSTRFARLDLRGQIFSTSDDAHVSEVDAEGLAVDGEITNAEDLDQLYRQATALLDDSQGSS